MMKCPFDFGALTRYQEDCGRDSVTPALVFGEPDSKIIGFHVANRFDFSYYLSIENKVICGQNEAAKIVQNWHCGCVYDTEIGLYYLQSRYYDPEIGRFLNADALVATGQGLLGNNMFVYCLNNPINYVDSGGTTAEALQWWISSMWWLCGADTVLPIGDLLFSLGAIVLLYEVFCTTNDPVITVDNNESRAENNTSTQAEQGSISAPSSPEPPNNNNRKPSLKKLTKYLIKKLGIDPHDLKYEYLGNGSEVKLYDLAYDTTTGIVYIITKAGLIVAETYYNVMYDSLLP